MPSPAARILAAATALVATQGHRQLSMRKLGQAVGTTAMALYRHYRHREALLDAVAESGFHRLEAGLAPTDRGMPPRDRLEALFAAYLEFCLSEPHLFELMFLTERGGIRRFPEDFENERSRSFRGARGAVKACMEAGEFRPDDSLETTLGLWAHAHGLVTLYRVGRFGSDPALFRGIFRRSLHRHLEALSR